MTRSQRSFWIGWVGLILATLVVALVLPGPARVPPAPPDYDGRVKIIFPAIDAVTTNEGRLP